MSEFGIKKRIEKKNIQDTAITILIIAVTVLIYSAVYDDAANKLLMIITSVVTMAVYFTVYRFSKSELTKSIDRLMDNELKDFISVSEKVLQLSEKQKSLTKKYTDMLDELLQDAKLFKNGAAETKEKTQNMSFELQKTYDSSEQESKSLSNNIIVMQNLKNKVQVIAELIIELTEYIKQIGSTVNTVENISEQTNMLALNAAVEAARAGEYGKGFAVVAGEIRKLADESKQATNKITSLVSEIEQTTSSTIMAAEDSAKEIENGVKNASDISDNINRLTSDIKVIGIELNDLVNANINQQSLTNSVLESIDTMQKSISETLRTLDENIENIRVFSKITSNIKDNIGKQQ